MYVINRTRGTYLGINIQVADTLRARLIGLYRHPQLRFGDGIWLVPCNSIQTIGMRYPIDVIFLDAGSRVVSVGENIRAGQVILNVHGAHSALEIPTGVISSSETQVGDQVEFIREISQQVDGDGSRGRLGGRVSADISVDPGPHES